VRWNARGGLDWRILGSGGGVASAAQSLILSQHLSDHQRTTDLEGRFGDGLYEITGRWNGREEVERRLCRGIRIDWS
jgi:hypothetical protein